MLEPSRMYHTGCLVEDVEASMKRYSDAAGIRWAKPSKIEGLEFWLPDRGMVRYDHLIAYSVDGPVHLELQRGAPGSFYDPALRTGYHIGFWSDDVAKETAELLVQGWKVECAGSPPEQGYGLYTYLSSADGGMMIELVASWFRAPFQTWLAGGDLVV